MKSDSSGLLLLSAAAGLGLLLAAVGSSSSASSGPPGAWRMKVLRAISKHEGQPDSIQRNLDGAGLSFGILQWTQAGGGLARVLDSLHQKMPARVEQIMGGPDSYARLIAHLRAHSLEPLDGALLWNTPWLERWQKLGRDADLSALQWQIALNSEYISVVPVIAKILGVHSERAYALIADRAVHQGVGGATSTARALADFWQSHPAPMRELPRLAAYGWACANNFRSDTPRVGWTWVEPQIDLSPEGTLTATDDGAYHLIRGPWDLWNLILRRTAEILHDPQWSDGPVSG